MEFERKKRLCSYMLKISYFVFENWNDFLHIQKNSILTQCHGPGSSLWLFYGIFGRAKYLYAVLIATYSSCCRIFNWCNIKVEVSIDLNWVFFCIYKVICAQTHFHFLKTTFQAYIMWNLIIPLSITLYMVLKLSILCLI